MVGFKKAYKTVSASKTHEGINHVQLPVDQTRTVLYWIERGWEPINPEDLGPLGETYRLKQENEELKMKLSRKPKGEADA